MLTDEQKETILNYIFSPDIKSIRENSPEKFDEDNLDIDDLDDAMFNYVEHIRDLVAKLSQSSHMLVVVWKHVYAVGNATPSWVVTTVPLTECLKLVPPGEDSINWHVESTHVVHI